MTRLYSLNFILLTKHAYTITVESSKTRVQNPYNYIYHKTIKQLTKTITIQNFPTQIKKHFFNLNTKASR